MTTLTLPLVLLVMYALVSRHRYMFAIVIAASVPAGAALVLGGIAIPVLYAAILPLPFVIILEIFDRKSQPWRPLPPVPGEQLLYAFALWVLVLTLVAPIFLAGLTIDSYLGSFVMGPGAMSKSTIAQLIYLAMDVLVVVYLKNSPGTGPWVVITPIVVSMSLSFWKFTNVAFPAGFFDNNPTFVYQETLPGGQPRFRGIMSEPAAVGTMCVSAIVLSVSSLPRATPRARLGWLALLAASVAMGIASTSTTFIVTLAVMVVLGLGVMLSSSVVRPKVVGPYGAIALLGVVAAAILFLPRAAQFVQTTIAEKQGSASATERGDSNDYAYHLFNLSHGLGLGIGTYRPSSFFAMLLAQTGVIGALLFIAVMVRVITSSVGIAELQPIVWVLLAQLTAKLLAGPDLSEPTGLTWLCLGTLMHTVAMKQQSARPPLPQLTPSARGAV